jgi:hypothetical protein
MTLKQRFENTMISFLIDRNQDKSMLDHFEKLTDEFAIEFAEWSTHYIDKNTNIYGDILHAKSKYDDMYTSKELLEIFKKEKGL